MVQASMDLNLHGAVLVSKKVGCWLDPYVVLHTKHIAKPGHLQLIIYLKL